MNKEIVSNKARCNLCGDIIESEHTHDFRRCSCGNLSIDGGIDYLKRLVKHSRETWTEMTEYSINLNNEGGNSMATLNEPFYRVDAVTDTRGQITLGNLGIVGYPTDATTLRIQPSDVSSRFNTFRNFYLIDQIGINVTGYSQLDASQFNENNIWGIEVRLLINDSIRIGNTFLLKDLDRLNEEIKIMNEEGIKYKLVTV